MIVLFRSQLFGEGSICVCVYLAQVIPTVILVSVFGADKNHLFMQQKFREFLLCVRLWSRPWYIMSQKKAMSMELYILAGRRTLAK